MSEKQIRAGGLERVYDLAYQHHRDIGLLWEYEGYRIEFFILGLFFGYMGIVE